MMFNSVTTLTLFSRNFSPCLPSDVSSLPIWTITSILVAVCFPSEQPLTFDRTPGNYSMISPLKEFWEEGSKATIHTHPAEHPFRTCVSSWVLIPTILSIHRLEFLYCV